MSCKALILEFLERTNCAYAVHEMRISGYSENNVATRCNDLEREGKIGSRYRKGTKFKEWFVKAPERLDRMACSSPAQISPGAILKNVAVPGKSQRSKAPGLSFDDKGQGYFE